MVLLNVEKFPIHNLSGNNLLNYLNVFECESSRNKCAVSVIAPKSKVSFFSVAGYTNPLRRDREMAVFLQNLDLKRNTKLRVDSAVQWRNVKEISR